MDLKDAFLMSSRGAPTRFLNLSPNEDVLNPLDGGQTEDLKFESLLNAHGVYETTRFLLRLSPRVHELVGSIGEGPKLLADVDSEVIKAYSTYIHETVHWWQHIGSTSGLLLSLSFLGQTHPSLEHLRNAVAKFGPYKSLKSWTDKILRSEGPMAQAKLYDANIAVNNALDIEYYKWFAFAPRKSAPWLIEQQHFESVGHSYHIAYGHLLSMLSDTIDPTFSFLPDARAWDASFKDMNDQRVHGHYWRSPIEVPPLGLHAIFEGQARFTQLQFLDRTHKNSPTCDEWRAKGYLSGIYVSAFEKFLELSGCDWPRTIDDPIVNLFLLVCDLAINPTVGFPFDIDRFESFIFDVDVGLRFYRFSVAVKELPQLRDAIIGRSRAEYEATSEQLTESTGDDHPLAALAKVKSWVDESPTIQALLEEQRTFQYGDTNIALRVLVSHFLSFSLDKLEHPEFFCWVGANLAGTDLPQRSAELWMRHLSLFTDRGDRPGVYTRQWPGRKNEDVRALVEKFYTSLVLYDLTRQWLVEDGSFKVDVDWIFQSTAGDAHAWVNDVFKKAYGIDLKDVRLVAPSGS